MPWSWHRVPFLGMVTGPFVSRLFPLNVEAVGGEGSTRWQQALIVLSIFNILVPWQR